MLPIRLRFSVFFLLHLASCDVYGQFEAGQTYFDDSLWVEYHAGNLPILLVSSHGGYNEPSVLPDRDCEGCKYLRDAYTQEITRMAAAEIHSITGCYPHVVYNLLHRKKLDANREIIEATDSSAITEPPWFAFHEFIDSASASIEAEWGKGLVIDVHGHAHDLQRLEIGTLLSDADLMLPDEDINQESLINKSSCKHLINNNISAADHVELLRGISALGSMLDTCGWPSIPSYNIPLLGEGEPHFNGGYITTRHGSRDGGSVDAIQIEGNNEMRWDEIQRAMFADTLALKLLVYIDHHYLQNFVNGYCGINTENAESIQLGKHCIELLSDPLSDWYVIDGLIADYDITILDALDQVITSYQNTGTRLAIDKGRLPSGKCFIHIKSKTNAALYVHMLIKE